MSARPSGSSIPKRTYERISIFLRMQIWENSLFAAADAVLAYYFTTADFEAL